MSVLVASGVALSLFVARPSSDLFAHLKDRDAGSALRLRHAYTAECER